MRAKLLASMLMLSAGAVHAQPNEVRRGPAPVWAKVSEMLPVPKDITGPVFVRRQDSEVHLSKQGQKQYLGYRVKLLNSSALPLGNITLKWTPPQESPIVHKIVLYREGKAIDALAHATFEVIRREDQLEAAKLDGTLTAVFHVPDLRVGDELELEATTSTSDPTLRPSETGLIAINQAPSPGRYHVRLGWEDRAPPKLSITSDLTRAVVKSETGVDFTFDNPPVLTPPNDAPPRYSWQRVVEYSDFSDWPALSRRLAPLFAGAAKLAAGSPVKLEASRIAAAYPTSIERAKAALKLVQQDVRYIYVGLNSGKLVPASADETWQRRYGDCKGKTALLLALLTELGIRAEPVLVNSSGGDDGFDQRLPMPELFDHVFVRAQLDGTVYWLDGTLPPVAGPSRRPVIPVKFVLPLSTSGSSLEKLPWQPASTPEEVTLYEIDARAGFDKPARVVTTQVTRGVKGLAEQIQFSALSPGQLLAYYRQQAIGDVWQEIEDVQWRYDERAGASILKVSGIGKVNWDDDGGGARSLALPGGGFNPPERHARASGSDQQAPFYTKPEYTCHATTVRLPASTHAEQWHSTPSFDQYFFGRNYHRAWELRDGSIRMVRGSRIEQPEIEASVAQRDNSRLGSFDNSMGWISYKPQDQKGAVGKGEKVPATFDLDWTADDVPCIAPAKGR